MQDFSLQYIKRGLSVIPVRGKVPLEQNWQRFSHEQLEEPISHPDQTGIGLVCGKASGIVAVDIDTDDESFKGKIPCSPVVRIGKKGEVRFFQYNGESSQSFKFLDIISTGRQVVLPPSIHPDTGKPYTWKSHSLLDFDLSNLPILNLSFTYTLEKLDGKSGRNNRLKDIAYAMACQGGKAKDIAARLLEEDSKHSPQLFTDLKEGMRGPAEDNALRFAKNIIKTAGQNGDLPDSVGGELVIKPKTSPSWAPMPYPKPPGLIGDIFEAIQKSSYAQSATLSTGGAISIASTIMGNFYQFEGMSGNVFALGIAESGTGKSFSSTMAKKLLAPHDLYASADFVSSQAVTADVQDWQVLFRSNEEFSKLLKLAQGNSWQAAIPQELCRLWEAPEHGLAVSVTKGGESRKSYFEGVYTTMLATTTFSEFRQVAGSSLFTSGLMPRFLMFIEWGKAKKRMYLDRDAGECFEFAENSIKPHIERIKKAAKSRDNVKRYKLSQDGRLLFEEHWHLLNQDKATTDAMRIMYSRAVQQYKKLALLSAWASHDELEVRPEDLAWAFEVLTACLHNMEPLVNESSAEDMRGAKLERIYHRVASSSDGVSKRDLMRELHLSLEDYIKSINTLEAQERVARSSRKTASGRSVEIIVALED